MLASDKNKGQRLLGVKFKRDFWKTVMYIFLSAYTVLALYPFYFSFISSFKDNQSILFTPFSLPEKIDFSSYSRAFGTSHIAGYFKNSVILAVGSCLILIFIGSSVAYAISKFEFKWKNQIYLYFLMGMMIPAQSTILPLAFDIGKLHIQDSMLAVILVITAFQIPINVLIFNGFMSTIPDALEEAAIIDGCSVFYVYWRIILPLSVPAIVTVTILNFLNAWNNLLFPLIFLSKDSLKTISIGLLSFFGEKQSDLPGVMAAIVVSCLPPFLVYIFAQEKVEQGLTAGAVKG